MMGENCTLSSQSPSTLDEFTLVDLEDVEEEVEQRDRKKFFRILDKLNSTFTTNTVIEINEN